MTALADLVAEGKHALHARPVERVSLALDVLPKLVAALDGVELYRTEIADVRRELTVTVRRFREAVWAAQKAHPEVTYKAGPVQRELRAADVLLARLDRLIHEDAP